MTALWPLGGLLGIVAAVLWVSRRSVTQRLFQYVPTPLWCYALPMLAVACRWLPRDDPSYGVLTSQLLPVALALLLLGVDLVGLMRTGRAALAAMAIGTISIVIGAPLAAWLLRPWLPPDAWTGVGSLVGTWTGGTMNLVALRTILHTPEAIFTSLILVDAMIAYSWMALLVGLAPYQAAIDQWLHAKPLDLAERTGEQSPTDRARQPCTRPALLTCAMLSLGLVISATALARCLPSTTFINSSAGWTVVLVTTVALSLSFIAPIRRLNDCATTLGYPCLYLVLAAVGAQARVAGLWSAPVWVVLGVGVALVHGMSMVGVGRLCRLPWGLLATASQANFGGVVSAPLVGAVYHQSLAPVGLLLAIGANALGTYLGLGAAVLCRWLTPVSL